MAINSIIVGTGTYLPKKIVPNIAFTKNQFIKKTGQVVNKASIDIINKLEQISGIKQRRYLADDTNTAQIGAYAGEAAIQDSGVAKEDIDQIIVAHNFGNLPSGECRSYLLPNLAALIKKEIGIKNPKCKAVDLLFGCPGWIEGLIQAHYILQSGRAKNILVIGVDSMSRILDEHDLDSMLFGDGAGAAVLQAEESNEKRGILAEETYSHCEEEVEYLTMGKSNHPEKNKRLYIKMQGKNVYKYAVNNVPGLVSECLNKASVQIQQVAKFLFHQANEKMIMAIAERIFKQHNYEASAEKVLPLTVQDLGNTSVATVPTMLDLIMKNKMPNHQLHTGDTVVMASVGAGMHCNCLVYKF